MYKDGMLVAWLDSIPLDRLDWVDLTGWTRLDGLDWVDLIGLVVLRLEAGSCCCRWNVVLPRWPIDPLTR